MLFRVPPFRWFFEREVFAVVRKVDAHAYKRPVDELSVEELERIRHQAARGTPAALQRMQIRARHRPA